jgi:hypothetical protein
LAVLLLAVLVGFVGYFVFHVTRPPAPVPLTGTYHAVLLNNGQAYFGQVDQTDPLHPVLTDVYYIQSSVDPKTKNVTNTLVKRGNELHAPDRMVLNANHILLLEPVTADSKVAKLIEDLKKRK